MITITAKLIEFIAPVIENEPESISYIKEMTDHFKESCTKEELQTFANETHYLCVQLQKENKDDFYYNKKMELALKFRSIIGLDSEQELLLKLLPSTYPELQKEKTILIMIEKLARLPGDYDYFMAVLLLLMWVEILRKNRNLIFERQMVLGEYNTNKKFFGDSEIDNNEHYEKVIKLLQNKNQQ